MDLGLFGGFIYLFPHTSSRL